VEEVRGGERG
jgi:hypothetical protein